SEIGPLATITVKRAGGTASGVTVAYATSDGSGEAWTNYLPASGTLTFDDGETSKTFTVPVLDDGLSDGNKTVNLALSNPGGGAAPARQTRAPLWMVGREWSSSAASALRAQRAAEPLPKVESRPGR